MSDFVCSLNPIPYTSPHFPQCIDDLYQGWQRLDKPTHFFTSSFSADEEPAPLSAVIPHIKPLQNLDSSFLVPTWAKTLTLGVGAALLVKPSLRMLPWLDVLVGKSFELTQTHRVSLTQLERVYGASPFRDVGNQTIAGRRNLLSQLKGLRRQNYRLVGSLLMGTTTKQSRYMTLAVLEKSAFATRLPVRLGLGTLRLMPLLLLAGSVFSMGSLLVQAVNWVLDDSETSSAVSAD